MQDLFAVFCRIARNQAGKQLTVRGESSILKIEKGAVRFLPEDKKWLTPRGESSILEYRKEPADRRFGSSV